MSSSLKEFFRDNMAYLSAIESKQESIFDKIDGIEYFMFKLFNATA